ncbi:MAG: flavodoxin family protein [Gordonibacter sp.]|nr:flavodoxin family protein [Gordonibacter sp.]
MANILVVHGSPRKGGNSSMLADAFIEGAQAAGNTVTRIDVGNLAINGCKACEYCLSHEGECIQQDAMQDLYPKMKGQDVLVYAFPLYYYSYPAQIKAFMDRMFCAVGNPGMFEFNKTALLMCFEDKDTSTADGLIKSYEIISNHLKQEIIGEVIVNAVYEKGAIKGNPGIEQARELGASIK